MWSFSTHPLLAATVLFREEVVLLFFGVLISLLLPHGHFPFEVHSGIDNVALNGAGVMSVEHTCR